MKYPELGIYTLPGHNTDTSVMLDEVREAEQLGLGSVWLSERFDIKGVPTCADAAAAITSEIHIATGATNHFIRHPQVTATFGATMQRLSKGRFALGLARGVGVRSQMMGLKNASNAELEDFCGLMRCLWSGERVVGHRGPCGEFPYLSVADWFQERIPLLVCAFGRKSLQFMGSVFDGVILHTFMSDQAVERAVTLTRKAAEQAGRNPEDVKVWAMPATVCDASEERQLKNLTARMATYLQVPSYGELLVDINEWDPAILERFRAAEVVRSMPGGIDQVASFDQLREIRDLIPEEWLLAAVGTPEECARRWLDQFDAGGADGILIHACTPYEAAVVLEAYDMIRPAEKFEGRTGQPA